MSIAKCNCACCRRHENSPLTKLGWAALSPAPGKPGPLPPREPSTISKIYFMREDLHEFERKCDLGDFRNVVASLYPHVDHAKDCVVYVPEQLLRAEREKAFGAEYAKWRKDNPDFEPKNRYDDFFKDAFYLGYGRGREDASKLAARKDDAKRGGE